MAVPSPRVLKRTPFWILASVSLILLILGLQPRTPTPPSAPGSGSGSTLARAGWGVRLPHLGFGLGLRGSHTSAGAYRAPQRQPKGVGWKQDGKTYRPLREGWDAEFFAGRVNMSAQRVMVFEEEFYHDEVVVAIASTLARAGAEVIIENHPRYGFEEILPEILGYEPIIENPYEPLERSMEQRLKAGTLDHLILTTCHNALRKNFNAILASSVNVVCFYHNGGTNFQNAHIDLLRPLAKQGRASVVVLGEHVAQWARMDVLDWCEKEGPGSGWEQMPLEVFAPVFDYPALRNKPVPKVWPSTAVIQGNLEVLRRNYHKVLNDLNASLTADPALWGYLPPSAPGGPFTPSPAPDASPFQLLLIGQRNQKDPLVIPPELAQVVYILEDMLYPDFYEGLAIADIVVPAFYHPGYYVNTASSTVPAALIARTPLLVSRRHLETYTYLDHPAIVERPMEQGDVAAIAEMRATGRLSGKAVGRGTDEEWDALLGRLGDGGADMWHRLFALRERNRVKMVDPDKQGS